MAAGTYDYYQHGQPGQGAPPPPGQQAAYQEPPPPRPQPAPVSRPTPGAGSDIIFPRAAGIIMLLGVLIFFIGIIVAQATTLMEHPDRDDFDDTDDYDKAVEDYEDRVRNLTGSGRILMWVGAMIIVLPLLTVGISGESVDWRLRAAMIIMGTLVIIMIIYVLFHM